MTFPGYRNIVDNRNGTVKLFTWDDSGKRVSYNVSHQPYLMLEDSGGRFKSIYGTKLSKTEFRNSWDRSQFVNKSNITRFFENFPVVQQYLIDAFWRDNESFEFSQHPIKTHIIDIETYPNRYFNGHIVSVRDANNVDNEVEMPVEIVRNARNLKLYRADTIKAAEESEVDIELYNKAECTWEYADTKEYVQNILKWDNIEVFDEEQRSWTAMKTSCYVLDKRFPNYKDPKHIINVITLYDTVTKKYHTWGLGPWKSGMLEGVNDDDVEYIHCKTEKQIMLKFMDHFEGDYPDILTAWNIGFDLPYMINRFTEVFGEEFVARMSPTKRVYSRTMAGMFGKETDRYYLEGISCIDYIDIYKKFIFKNRPNYKLDSIAGIELGDSKIDYGNRTIFEFAEQDWQKFVDYNIQDVAIIVRLDEKLQFLKLLRMFAYVGLTTFESAMGAISVINGSIAVRARNNRLCVPMFRRPRNDDKEKNPGAYVAMHNWGFQEDIVSFDANSLYPSAMITCNISPETKLGKIIDSEDGVLTIDMVDGSLKRVTHTELFSIMKQEQLSMTGAKVLFSQKKKGIVPEVVDYYYGKRVEVKEKMIDISKEISDLERELAELT